MSKEEAVTVASAYGSDKRENHLKYFRRKCPEILEDFYLWNSACTNADNLKEEILITDKRILFTPIIKSWGMTSMVRPVEVPFNAIKHLEVSFHYHSQTDNFNSITQQFLVLNFVTTDQRSFRKLQWIGNNEAERNENRPRCLRQIEKLSEIFLVVEVKSSGSASDSTVRFGMGVFDPLD